MLTYYVLLIRDDMHSPWGVHFGCFHKETVTDERDDLKDGGMRASQIKIIQSTGTQADIDEMVKHLNANL
mgnify:CR=1 FL=1